MNKKSFQSFLYVEVLKHGQVHARARYPMASFLKKNIGLSASSGGLMLPNATFKGLYPFFKIGRNNVTLVAKSGMRGFVLSRAVFSSLDRLLKEKEKEKRWRLFKKVKIQLNLELGSQGCLAFQGYDIIFKIRSIKTIDKKTAVVVKNKNKKKIPLLGAGRSGKMNYLIPFLEWSEKISLALATATVAAVLLPAMLWLKKEEIKPSQLLHMHREAYLGFINPIHFQQSAGILEDKFDTLNPGSSVTTLVNDMLMRWNSSDKENLISEETFLSQKPTLLTKDELAEEKEKRNKFLEQFRREQSNKKHPSRVFLALKEVSAPVIPLAGGTNLSLKERARLHVDKMKEMYQAYNNYQEEEFKYLQGFFKNLNVKYEKPLTIPDTGQLFYSKPGPEYYQEIERYKQGQLMAEQSQIGSFIKFIGPSVQESRTLVVASDLIFEKPSEDTVKGDTYFSNLDLLLDVSKLPPPYVEKPTISKIEVDRFLKTKQEQIRLCYDASLRQNVNFFGKLLFSWTIDTRGKARNLKIIASKNVPSSFMKCMEEKFNAWKFPPARNGVVAISYPMEFVVRKER